MVAHLQAPLLSELGVALRGGGRRHGQARVAVIARPVALEFHVEIGVRGEGDAQGAAPAALVQQVLRDGPPCAGFVGGVLVRSYTNDERFL